MTGSVYVGEKTERGLEWTAAPDLLKERYCHRSITIDNKIYHIGGLYDDDVPGHITK